MQNFLMESFLIHSYEVDFQQQLTAWQLSNFLQEIAWKHAEQLGLGFNLLQQQNMVWVLAKQQVRIHRYPQWQETVQIKTWPCGYNRLICYRDFLVLDQHQNCIAEAATDWVVLDTQNHRPQPTKRYYELELDFLPAQFEHPLPKVKDSSSQEYTEKTVQFSDLDMNRHVNNVKYLEWILNTFSREFHESHNLTGWNIHFIQEAFYGEKVLILNETDNNGLWLHRIVRAESRQEIFRAETLWEPSPLHE